MAVQIAGVRLGHSTTRRRGGRQSPPREVTCDRQVLTDMLGPLMMDRTQSRARHDGDLSIQVQETSGAHLRREAMA